MDAGGPIGAVFVRLLGRPQVRWPGGSDDLLSGLPKRLLAYVAVRGGDVARDDVASLLWPRHELNRRRGNLRRLLGRAKQLPYANGLVGDRERVRWAVATDLDVIRAGDGEPGARAELLNQTLLDGIDLDDDDAFTDWLREERERLALLRRRLLMDHASARREAGDAAAAAAILDRLVEEDPLDEDAIQRLLEVASAAGVSARARSAYRRFAVKLQDELALEPLDTTRALAATLGASELGSDDAPSPAAGLGSLAAASGSPSPADLPPLDLAAIGRDLIGRAQALQRLRASGAAMVLVVGEPGIGKTALVMAATAGMPSMFIRAEDEASGRPFAAVEPALRSRLQTSRARILEALEPWERDAIAHLVPEVAAAMRTTRRIVDASEGRARLVAAAARTIALLVGRGGAIVADDLHRLDGASAEVVAAIARGQVGAAMPPRVFATARSGDLADAPGRGAFVRLQRDGLLEELTLEPWSEAELHELIVRLSGHAGGQRFARRLHAATGGNPLFVLETLRHLFVVGVLRVEPSGGWSTPYDEATADYAELPLPASVRDAVLERVARLDGGTRRLLEAAALAVPPFTLRGIAPATALSEWLALEALERAVRAGLLVASGQGYRFGHDLLRTAIADGLGAERRALIERRLAWALEREQGAASLIAAHFERAGRRADAYRWHRRAAEEATALYVSAIAIEHLERATALAEHDRDRVESLLAWAELLDRTVEPVARAAVLDRAAEVADRLGDPTFRASVALARMRLRLDLGDVVGARSAGELARPLAREAGLVAALHLALARVHLRGGDFEAARRELDAGSPHLPAGPNELRGRYHLEGYVSCAHLGGDLAAAFEHVEAARAVFDAIGHRELLAEALNFHGIFLAIDARHDEGIAKLQEGLNLAREVGHVAVQRRALLNLVKLHTDRADAEAAAPLVAEGLALAHDFEQHTTEVAFLLADGYVRYLRADVAGAIRSYERAATVADADGNPMWRVQARLIAVTPRIHTHDRAGARAVLADAEALVDTHALEFLRARLDARRAALALADGDAAGCLALLERWLDRPEVPAEERGEHACLRAEAFARLGDHASSLASAEACRRAPTLEVVVAGEALALEATLALGHDVGAAMRAAQARLDDGRVPPFESLALLRALANAHEHSGNDAAACALRSEADARERQLLTAVAL